MTALLVCTASLDERAWGKDEESYVAGWAQQISNPEELPALIAWAEWYLEDIHKIAREALSWHVEPIPAAEPSVYPTEDT